MGTWVCRGLCSAFTDWALFLETSYSSAILPGAKKGNLRDVDEALTGSWASLWLGSLTAELPSREVILVTN